MTIDQHNDMVLCYDMMRRQSGVTSSRRNESLISVIRELFREWGQPTEREMNEQRKIVSLQKQ